MPILGAISLLFQIYFAVHSVKTGKDRYWLYIIILFPGVGCLIYFFSEFLPEFRRSPEARTARRNLTRLVDPGGELPHLREQLELADTVKNRLALAEGCVNSGLFDEAVSLYESCLDGPHKDDPPAVEGLCCAHFFMGNYGRAKDALFRLRDIRGNKAGDEFDLMLARCHEERGETEAALAEYEALEKSFSGEEARCRYALLLKKLGRTEEARTLFQKILDNIRLSPKFHKKSQKEWGQIAKTELQGLSE